MESTPGEFTPVKTMGMTMKDLEHSISLVGKAAVAAFERIDSNFEGNYVGNMLSNGRETIRESKSQSM